MSLLTKDLELIARCMTNFKTTRLRAYGVVGSQTALLFAICREPGITQDQLAGRLYINKSNVARKLASMEEAGIVERRGDEKDRRITLVYPTQRGEGLLPVVRKTNQEWIDYITAGMTTEEIELLEDFLTRLTARATEYVEVQRKK